MRAISPDGVEIIFDVCGSGEPAVVLVHGWSCDSSYWRDQLEPLSRHYRVITLDLAGHGDSGAERREWTIASFGSDVATVVAHLGLRDVVLVGHSMGGDVVLEAARQLAKRVRGIVWVDTYNQLNRFSTPQQVRARMAPFETNFVQTTRQFVRRMFAANADAMLIERVVADMSAAPPHVALAAMQSAWTYGSHVPGLLRSLGIPIAAINPEDPASDLKSMHEHGIDVTCISGAGHFVMMEQPQRFNECLLKVISTFVGGGHRGGHETTCGS
jgi:pimeloyl-ACP methyl ester carboxylesterase